MKLFYFTVYFTYRFTWPAKDDWAETRASGQLKVCIVYQTSICMLHWLRKTNIFADELLSFVGWCESTRILWAARQHEFITQNRKVASANILSAGMWFSFKGNLRIRWNWTVESTRFLDPKRDYSREVNRPPYFQPDFRFLACGND